MTRLGAAGLLVAALTSAALAEESSFVYIEIDPCAAVDVALVRRVVSIELGAPLASVDKPHVTRVTGTCEGRTVLLTVEDPLSGRKLSRRLDLSRGAESGRARLLALAAVELVVSGWTELRTLPRERVVEFDFEGMTLGAAREGAEVVGAPRPEPVFPCNRVALAAFATRRLGQGLHTFGAGVEAGLRVSPPFRISVDAVVERGTAPVDVGEMRGTLLSGGPRAGIVVGEGFVEVELAAGARLGVAFLDGQPAMASDSVRGGSFTAVWGGPTATLAVRAGSEQVAMRIGAELAWTALSVHAAVLGTPERVIGGVGTLLSLAVTGGW